MTPPAAVFLLVLVLDPAAALIGVIPSREDGEGPRNWSHASAMAFGVIFR